MIRSDASNDDDDESMHDVTLAVKDIEQPLDRATQIVLEELAQAEMFINGLLQPNPTEPTVVHISPQHRSLLYYFQHELTLSLCTTTYGQQEFCAAVLPIAHNNQHTLAALLTLALSYRASTTKDLKDEAEATELSLEAIHWLRESLNTPPDADTAVASLAASLLLSIANMFALKAPKNWHIYLDGALALRECLAKYPVTTESECLARWCHGYKLITFNSDSGDINAKKENYPISLVNRICHLSGISVALSPVLELIREFCRKHKADPTLIHDISSPIYISYIRLVELITMLLRRRMWTIISNPNLSAQANRDLWLLDEAYHHTALLQLHRCIHTAEKPLTRTIRASVRRIIECIGGMNLTTRPNYVAYILNPLRQACKSAGIQDDKDMLVEIIEKARCSVPLNQFTLIQRYIQ